MRFTSVALLFSAALAVSGCATRNHDYGYRNGEDVS